MMPAHQREAFGRFCNDVARHYGRRLEGLFVFGSRARGDGRPDSDIDVVVVLRDGDWRFLDEKLYLSDLGFEALLEDGIYIQPWPISRSAWNEPETHYNPSFVRGMRRDARPVGEVA